MKKGRPKATTGNLPEGWYNEILSLYQKGAED
jgi:hypothetical protein